MIAVDNIDEVIQIIRSSSTAEDARQKLADRFELDEIQTRAIVEMRLRQLTGLEMDKLRNEYEEVMKLIQHLNDILNNDAGYMYSMKSASLLSLPFAPTPPLCCALNSERGVRLIYPR